MSIYKVMELQIRTFDHYELYMHNLWDQTYMSLSTFEPFFTPPSFPLIKECHLNKLPPPFLAVNDVNFD